MPGRLIAASRNTGDGARISAERVPQDIRKITPNQMQIQGPPIPVLKVVASWLLAGVVFLFCLGMYKFATGEAMASVSDSLAVYSLQGGVFLAGAFLALLFFGIDPQKELFANGEVLKKDAIVAVKYFLIYAVTATAVILLLAFGAMLLMKMGFFSMDAVRGYAPKAARSSEILYLQGLVQSPAKSIFYLLTTCVLIPIEEEIFFRRLLFVSLRKNLAVPSSLLTASLLFSICHVPAASAASAFVVGLFLCWIYEKRENLRINIMVHGFINLFVTVAMMTMAYGKGG